MFLFWINARIFRKAGDAGAAVLLVTSRAKERLKEIVAKKAPAAALGADLGIRIVLTRQDNGSQANMCRIGVSEARAGDLTVDIGGSKLLIDSGTIKHLRHMSAILDMPRQSTGNDLVLIVGGDNSELSDIWLTSK
jgi:Fe-S cluster assembly iron-binding protein IscA